MMTTDTARIVYQSPDARVRVEREGHADFMLFLDGFYVGTHRTQHAAELAGLIWLEERAAELALDLADEAAARDALTEQATVAEAAPTLEQALNARGFTHKAEGAYGRHSVYDAAGMKAGSFDAHEAWAYLASLDAEAADPCQRCGAPATRTSHGQALCATCDPRGPDAAGCAVPAAPTPPASSNGARGLWAYAGCAAGLRSYIAEQRRMVWLARQGRIRQAAGERGLLVTA